jgi:hypothetical protein
MANLHFIKKPAPQNQIYFGTVSHTIISSVTTDRFSTSQKRSNGIFEG